MIKNKKLIIIIFAFISCSLFALYLWSIEKSKNEISEYNIFYQVDKDENWFEVSKKYKDEILNIGGEVIYVSKYLEPMITAKLTKEQFDIIKNEKHISRVTISPETFENEYQIY